MPQSRVRTESVILQSPQMLKSFSGYGQTGPFAKNAGYDVIIEAEGGLMHMCVTLAIEYFVYLCDQMGLPT